MDPTRVGFLAFLITAFKEALLTSLERLQPWVFFVFGFCLFLELVRICWVVSTDQGRVAQLVSFAIRLLCLCWLLPRWEYVFTTCTALGVQLGLDATGNVLTQAQFLSPGAYIELGAKLGKVLDAQWASSYALTPTGMAVAIGNSFLYFVAYALFMLAFIVMGGTLFIVQIEAAFALPLLAVKLPFLGWVKTYWIGNDVITYVVRLAFKLFALAVIASVAFPVMETITVTMPPDPRQAILMIGFAGLLALTFLKGPQMAMNMMAGQFSLHVGDIASTGLLVLQTAMMATGAAGAVGRVVGGTAMLVSGQLPSAAGAARTATANANTVANTLRTGARFMP